MKSEEFAIYLETETARVFGSELLAPKSRAWEKAKLRAPRVRA
jgi:hypothetical protein